MNDPKILFGMIAIGIVVIGLVSLFTSSIIINKNIEVFN